MRLRHLSSRLAIWLAAITGLLACTDSGPVVTKPTSNAASTVTVSGLSAGGYMAVQTHIALSDKIAGAASLAAGAVSHLYYADRINQLPLGVVGVALATALPSKRAMAWTMSLAILVLLLAVPIVSHLTRDTSLEGADYVAASGAPPI